jgi:hypothetical protein
LCAEHGLRAILNHRIDPTSPIGHYSVLVRLDGEEAVLHDPQFGPARRLGRADLLGLWGSETRPSDIAGNVLVAFTDAGTEAITCRACHATSPPSVVCPSCGGPIPLHPAAVLGCAAGSCALRAWEKVFCPRCDGAVIDLTGPRADAVDGRAGGDRATTPAWLAQRCKKEMLAIHRELVQQFAGGPTPSFSDLVEMMKERIGGVSAMLQAEYQAQAGLAGVPARPPAKAPTPTGSERPAAGTPAPPPRRVREPIGDEILDQEEIRRVIERLLRDHRVPSPSAEPGRRFPR